MGEERDCVLCGQCLEVCPLVQATGREELSPKAKQLLMRRLQEEPGELACRPAMDLAALCLGCNRCQAACTQGLSTADRLAQLRTRHPGWEQWVWRTWVEQGRLLWPLAAALGRLTPDVLPGERLKSMLARLKAMHGSRVLAPWLAVERYDTRAAGERMALFSGCTGTHLQGVWRANAEAVLRGLGYELDAQPGFSCCGKTLGVAGLPEAQTAMERTNLNAWRAADRPLVAVFCATCLHGLQAYAQRDELGWAPGEAERWLSSLRPLSGLWGETSFTVGDAAPQAVRYHRPCHMPLPDPDFAWLRRTLGTRLTGAGDRCCGMGGVFQLSDRGLSDRVAAACWEKLAAGPGVQVLTGCSGCVLQLRGTAPDGAAVGHWLEILLP